MNLREKALESEQALLGAAMLDDSWLTEAELSAADFLNEKNRIIWQSIERVFERREPVDLTTVHADMAARGYEWIAYLSEVLRNTPSSANWKGYQGALKRYGFKAQAVEILTDGLQGVHADESAVDQVITGLMALNTPSRNYDKSAKEFLAEAAKNIEARYNGDIRALPTGIKSLDAMLGGLHDSDLVVVAARPAMGKTAVMLNMALSAGEAVGIISGEQGADQVGERLFSISGGVSVERMRRMDLDKLAWDSVFKTSQRLVSENRLFVNDHPAPEITMIQRQARKWKHTHNIKALFVDYIQRIKGGDAKTPKHERIGDIVRALKSLARELDIPVVALAQVARAVEARPDKRPHMGDISDSSEVEKEADQVITLYRDEVYNDCTMDKGIIEFLVCKNRHGATGFTRAAWRGEFLQVRDLTTDGHGG